MEKNSQPARFLLLAVGFFLSLSLTDLLDILFILLILVFHFSAASSRSRPSSHLLFSSVYPSLPPSPNLFFSFCRLCHSRSVVTLVFHLPCRRLRLLALPLPAFIAVTVDSSRCHGEDPFLPAVRQLPWQRRKQ